MTNNHGYMTLRLLWIRLENTISMSFYNKSYYVLNNLKQIFQLNRIKCHRKTWLIKKQNSRNVEEELNNKKRDFQTKDLEGNNSRSKKGNKLKKEHNKHSKNI